MQQQSSAASSIHVVVNESGAPEQEHENYMSLIWNYFKKEDGIAYCNYCDYERDFPPAAPNNTLICHLRRSHPDEHADYLEKKSQADDEEMSENEPGSKGERVVFELGESQRGGTVLWFEGFRFKIKVRHGERSYWDCDQGKKYRCPVRAITSTGDPTNGRIIPSANPNEHNHEPEPPSRQKIEARIAWLKKKALEQPQMSTSDLMMMDLSTNEYDDEVFAGLPPEKVLNLRLKRSLKKHGITPQRKRQTTNVKQGGVTPKMINKTAEKSQTYSTGRIQQHLNINRTEVKRGNYDDGSDDFLMHVDIDGPSYDRRRITNNRSSQLPNHRYAQQSAAAQQHDRFTYFSNFVDAAIRDMNSQAPEVAGQLMQSIYATIANFQMQIVAAAPAPVPTTSSTNTQPIVGEHIEIQYV